MNNENPTYYAVIPANVRYDKRLKANEKLLYGEITCLAQKTGKCFASNSYFSDLYNVDKTTISRWISNLSKLGYINTIVQYKEDSKQIINRYILLNQYPIDENSNTYGRKDQYPIDEKIKDNNTSIITTKDEIKKLLTQEEIESNTKPLMLLWDMIQCGYKCNANRKSIMKDIERIKETLKIYKYWGEYSGYDRDRARMKIKELKDNIDAGDEVKNFKSKLNNYLSPKTMRGKQKK